MLQGASRLAGSKFTGMRAFRAHPGTVTLAALLLFAPGGARPVELPPPPPSYMGREMPGPIAPSGGAWLLRESREREERPDLLIAHLRSSGNLAPGMVVCDLGAGNGFYTLRLATEVGERGHVLAEDIQPELLATLKKRAAAVHVRNVETIRGTKSDPRLPAGGVDLILLVDVYHEFTHPTEMLAAIRSALRTGIRPGRVALVEFRGEDPDLPISPLHKMTRAQIEKEWTANGFRVVAEFEGLPRQHLLLLEAAPPHE